MQHCYQGNSYLMHYSYLMCHRILALHGTFLGNAESQLVNGYARGTLKSSNSKACLPHCIKLNSCL